MKTDTFNQQEIEKIVDRAFPGEEARALNYRLNRYSKDKVGFLGTHQNLEITVKRRGSNQSEILRFFVKSLPTLTEEQLKFIRERDLFGQEASYFNDVLPVLKKACPSTDDWSPRCFLATDKLVVLEDMRLRNYAMSDTKMLSEEQLKAAFRAQARLHAASLVAEKQLAKPLNQAYPKSCGEAIFNDGMLESKRLQLYTDLAERVAERLGRDGRRISAGFRKGFDQMYDQNQLSTRLPKVLEHGDAWPNNYLFDESDPPKCVLVDFQLTRYGPPTYDLLLLAYLSTNRQTREKVIGEAIEAYHAQFCKVLEQNNPEIERPSLDDVLEEYEQLRTTALLCAVMYYPVIWVGQSTIDKYDEEERYKRLMFRQDNSFVMQIYDEDEIFAEKMNEVIIETVEYFEQRDVPIEMNNDLH
ncbi:uncharacterized protein LOC131671115 [Phymastichus coffea]|uniref:uncharacterized protein LOC131671115 n=1 Tax=Phymastichus coffea TaxID=108790 RepID=UPI00273B6FEB|nr:uncharacterized protein LOC131671115 [Phymastichus coffea]